MDWTREHAARVGVMRVPGDRVSLHVSFDSCMRTCPSNLRIISPAPVM